MNQPRLELTASKSIKGDLATISTPTLRDVNAETLDPLPDKPADREYHHVGFARPTDDFDWCNDDAVVCVEQIPVAAYLNEAGCLVIRQKADWPHQEDDAFVIVAEANVMTFIDKICDLAGIPSVGGPLPQSKKVRPTP
jgi:hypothetical protein